MASGTIFGTTSNSVIESKIEWSSTSFVESNYSFVSASLYLRRTNIYTGTPTHGTGSFTISVEGTPCSIETLYVTIPNDNTWVHISTGQINITHNDDGKKSITITATGGITGTSVSSINCAGTVALDTIPRKSTISVGNGTLGVPLPITVTKASDSFTHTITYVCGNASGTVCTRSSSSSVSWDATNGNMVTQAAQAPNRTSVQVTFTIFTYSGDTPIGQATAPPITCAIPASVVPSVSISVSDPTGYASKYGKYVQGRSEIQIAISSSGIYGSSIRSTTTTAQGNTYTDSGFVSVGKVTVGGNTTITTSVSDTRNRSNSTSQTINVYAYTPAQISYLVVARCNADGTDNPQGEYLKAVFSASITSLDNKNSAAYTLQYKKVSESYYTAQTLGNYKGAYSVSGGVAIFAADTTSSYDVIITATDDFASTSRSSKGTSIEVFFSALKQGKGAAFFKVAEREDFLEVEGAIDATKGISVDGKPVYPQLDAGQSNVTSYPTAPGIYRTIGTNIFKNMTPASPYGVLVIFKPIYGMHLYLDSGSDLYYGYSGDAFAEPEIWVKGSTALTAYPIGSIYMSVNSTSPASLFGGTWSQLKDRFLLGAGSSYSNGATGGNATHTLTLDEIPSHTHSIPIAIPPGEPGTVDGPGLLGDYLGYKNTGTAGGGKAHNNMPPYLVVYMWKRTA